MVVTYQGEGINEKITKRVLFSNNDQVMSIEYPLDKMKVEYLYDKKGLVKQETNYLNENKHGKQKFYFGGTLYEEIEWKNGTKDGLLKTYDMNTGELSNSIYIKDGKFSFLDYEDDDNLIYKVSLTGSNKECFVKEWGVPFRYTIKELEQGKYVPISLQKWIIVSMEDSWEEDSNNFKVYESKIGTDFESSYEIYDILPTEDEFWSLVEDDNYLTEVENYEINEIYKDDSVHFCVKFLPTIIYNQEGDILDSIYFKK